jgi:tetratricopeptide (TPR) repeat protein
MVAVLATTLAAGGAAQASPEIARTYKAAGDGLVQRGRPEDAIQSYEYAVKEDPDWLIAYDALVASLFAARRFDDVITRLRPLMEKHPEHGNGWYSLGYAYRKTGRFAESVEAYKQYVKLRPEDAEGYYGLGRAQLALDQKDDAIASFTKYIKLEKRPTEQRWVENAKAEIEKLKAKGAVAEVKEEPAAPSARTPAARAAALVDWGDSLTKKGRWEDAYKLYVEARTLDGGSTRIYDALGESGIRVKRQKELVPMFRNVIAENPGYASGFYYLGLALNGLGKGGEALDALKRYCALMPSSPDGQYQLGMLLKEQGAKADADKALRKYLEVENRPDAEHEAWRKNAKAALFELSSKELT